VAFVGICKSANYWNRQTRRKAENSEKLLYKNIWEMTKLTQTPMKLHKTMAMMPQLVKDSFFRKLK
jgi:hypothetical protein